MLSSDPALLQIGYGQFKKGRIVKGRIDVQLEPTLYLFWYREICTLIVVN